MTNRNSVLPARATDVSTTNEESTCTPSQYIFSRTSNFIIVRSLTARDMVVRAVSVTESVIMKAKGTLRHAQSTRTLEA